MKLAFIQYLLCILWSRLWEYTNVRQIKCGTVITHTIQRKQWKDGVRPSFSFESDWAGYGFSSCEKSAKAFRNKVALEKGLDI